MSRMSSPGTIEISREYKPSDTVNIREESGLTLLIRNFPGNGPGGSIFLRQSEATRAGYPDLLTSANNGAASDPHPALTVIIPSDPG